MSDGQYFVGKPHARAFMWERLQSAAPGCAVLGRVPRFSGAEAATERLFQLPPLASARRIRVGREAALAPVRRGALARGMEVWVPTWHLRGGLRRLAPGSEPGRAGAPGRAALDEVPPLDAFIVAALAVARDGYFVGPGGGWADLEHTVLRELGHAPMPVLTIVHPSQRVQWFPAYEHDVPVTGYATPEHGVMMDNPPPPPRRIEWSRLARERFADLPVLSALKSRG